MANKPDGKPARVDRVNFTRPAAERIAKVVRKVEQGDRGVAGLRFMPRDGGGCSKGNAFSVCTYTGVWAIDSVKTVTFFNQTNTPNTAVARNLFVNLPNRGTGTNGVVGIIKERGDWYLWSWQQFTATAVFGSFTQSVQVVSGITVDASITTASCGVVVSATQATQTVSFMRDTYTCTYVTLEP